MGIMKRKKKIERIAKPFAARVCREKPLALRSSHGLVNEQVPYHDAVIPSKACQLVKTCDKIPPCGYVSGNEDAKGQHRERMHQPSCK
jgi:hypothetical protein